MRGDRRHGASWLAPRLLAGLLAACLLLGQAVHGAAGSDVRDTHRRLDRIYARLGIEGSGQPRGQDSWCTPARERPEQREERRAQSPRPPVWVGYVLILATLAGMLVPLFFVLKNSFTRDLARPRPEEEEAGPGPRDDGPRRREPWLVDPKMCRGLLSQGRLPEAFAALHRLTLLGLQRARHLTLDETTTNWEYVRRLASRPRLMELLTGVTRAAEQSVLGQSPPSVEEYARLEAEVLAVTRQGGAE